MIKGSRLGRGVISLLVTPLFAVSFFVSEPTAVFAADGGPPNNQFKDTAGDARLGYDVVSGGVQRRAQLETIDVHVRGLAKAGGFIVGTYNRERNVYAVIEVSRGIYGTATDVCVGGGTGKIPVNANGFTEPTVADDGYVCSRLAVVHWDRRHNVVRVGNLRYADTYDQLFSSRGLTFDDYQSFTPRQVVSETPDGLPADKVGNAHGGPL